MPAATLEADSIATPPPIHNPSCNPKHHFFSLNNPRRAPRPVQTHLYPPRNHVPPFPGEGWNVTPALLLKPAASRILADGAICWDYAKIHNARKNFREILE